MITGESDNDNIIDITEMDVKYEFLLAKSNRY